MLRIFDEVKKRIQVFFNLFASHRDAFFLVGLDAVDFDVPFPITSEVGLGVHLETVNIVTEAGETFETIFKATWKKEVGDHEHDPFLTMANFELTHAGSKVSIAADVSIIESRSVAISSL